VRSFVETLLGDQLPFEDHIEDDVVLMTGGGVLAAYALDGVYPDTSDLIDEAYWNEQLHTTMKNIAAEDIEITTYQCRGEASRSFYRPGEHTTAFARDLDIAYLDNLYQSTLYSNRLYITIQVHAPNKAAQGIASFFADVTSDPRVDIFRRAERLKQLCDLMQSQLREFGPRRLGYRTRGWVVFSEIAEEIVYAVTGRYRQIPASTGQLSHAMFSETIKFPSRGRNKGRIEIHGAGDVTYAEIYAFKEYPATTWPGMFYGMSVAPYCNTLAQSFRFMSNATALTALGRKQNWMEIAGDKATSQTKDLALAQDQLMSRQWVLGDHSLLLICFAESEDAMAAVSTETWNDLGACGLVATRLTRALQAGFLSLLPGAGFWRPRPGFVKSSNFIAYSPLYNWPAGDESSFWPGGPIATFRTRAGTPYRFSWHPPKSQDGNANTLITGRSGSGKTFLTSFLTAMTARVARIIALDHKRGWKFMIKKMGGDYGEFGNGQALFAPLKELDATPDNLVALNQLYRGCIGGTMSEEESRRLTIGLDAVMSMPAADRNVGELRAFFDSTPEGAGVRLEKWIWGNELGWVVDAPTVSIRFGQISGFDTTSLFDNPRARGPAMFYLFHRVEQMLDGSPLLLTVDEGWKVLLDETFCPFIIGKSRAIRSKGGILVFITQSPKEFAQSGIASVLVDQCANQIHLANPRGRREDYVNVFGLSDGQFDALHELQVGDGQFLLIQGDKGVVAGLPMQGLETFIPILSAREADLTADDRRHLVIEEVAV
jgi:type IV secretion system protein VirB4